MGMIIIFDYFLDFAEFDTCHVLKLTEDVIVPTFYIGTSYINV